MAEHFDAIRTRLSKIEGEDRRKDKLIKQLEGAGHELVSYLRLLSEGIDCKPAQMQRVTMAMRAFLKPKS